MRTFTFPKSRSSSGSVLKPTTTASKELISRFAFALIISVFVIFPIDAFTILIFDCLSKVMRASKLPSESALIIIPSLSSFTF